MVLSVPKDHSTRADRSRKKATKNRFKDAPVPNKCVHDGYQEGNGDAQRDE